MPGLRRRRPSEEEGESRPEPVPAEAATKSGGTTRRAAKMVCLDMDHPEIADFINWKVREEKKVQALISQGYSADFNGITICDRC